MAELDPEVVETLRLARAEKQKWADVEASAIEKIKAAMGDDWVGTVAGHTVATWKTSAPAVVLDEKRLRAELPSEVLAPYMREKAASRPFKLVE